MKSPLPPLEDVLEHFDRYLVDAAGAVELVSIWESVGRILAHDLVATEDFPLFNNSAMDGFAFRHADFTEEGDVTCPVVGIATAGHPFEGEVPVGGAVRIMTGAPMPVGLDTMIQIEKTQNTETEVTFDPLSMKAGANVRLKGEIYKENDVLVKAGTRINEGTATLAASMGLPTLSVYARPRVGVFASGDELIEPGSETNPPNGKIFNSNGILMHLLAQRWGADATYLGILPDDPDAVKQILADATVNFDLIVSSGGVGPGDKDFTGSVLAELATVEHRHSAMRPGKAVVFGRFNDGIRPFFIGLPGNPIATAVTAKIYLRRAIRALSGHTEADPVRHATLTARVRTRLGRRDFIAGTLSTNESGELFFNPMSGQSSTSLVSLAHQTVTGIIPEAVEKPEAGLVIKLLPED